MARSLIHSPPSSTVARLLDAGAAARATSAAPIAPSNVPTDQGLPPTQDSGAVTNSECATIKRELTLSPAGDDVFEQLIELYRRATGTRLSASHLARAMLRGLAHCLPALQREANRIGRLKLPSNARGRELERERFEDRSGFHRRHAGRTTS
jgi:hypothetical protein